MIRFALERVCGFLLLMAVAIAPTAAIVPTAVHGQTNQNPPPIVTRRSVPLQELPPIVSSDQSVRRQSTQLSMLAPLKPVDSSGARRNVPPIISPSTNAIPFEENPAPQVPVVQGNRNKTFAPPMSIQNDPIIVDEFPVSRFSRPEAPARTAMRQGSGSRTPFPIPQGSGTRSFPAPQSLPGTGNQSLPAIVAPSDAPSLPSRNFNGTPGPFDLPAVPQVENSDTPESVVEERSLNRSQPEIDGVPGTNDFFDPAESDPLSIPGTPSDTGCATCGADGCYNLDHIQNQMGCSGSVASAGYYLFADALVWTREDGDIQLSTFFGLNDFDFTGGWRVTLGQRFDATHGRELTFMGIGELNESETATSAFGTLAPLFSGSGGFGFSPELTSFFNATSQTHRKETQFQSLEYNRVNWGWDLLKTTLGVRYIYFDDSTSFFSTNGTTNGLYVQDSVNNLFGVTGGFELFYDVGYRTSASLTTKFGGYVNSADVDTNLFNAGVQFLGQEVDEAAFASTIELGLLSHFQINPRARFRLGYDLLLMWGLFTIENNSPRATFARGFQTGTPTISPTTGANLNTNNEAVFFHGLSFGFEVFR